MRHSEADVIATPCSIFVSMFKEICVFVAYSVVVIRAALHSVALLHWMNECEAVKWWKAFGKKIQKNWIFSVLDRQGNDVAPYSTQWNRKARWDIRWSEGVCMVYILLHNLFRRHSLSFDIWAHQSWSVCHIYRQCPESCVSQLFKIVWCHIYLHTFVLDGPSIKQFYLKNKESSYWDLGMTGIPSVSHSCSYGCFKILKRRSNIDMPSQPKSMLSH